MALLHQTGISYSKAGVASGVNHHHLPPPLQVDPSIVSEVNRKSRVKNMNEMTVNCKHLLLAAVVIIGLQ